MSSAYLVSNVEEEAAARAEKRKKEKGRLRNATREEEGDAILMFTSGERGAGKVNINVACQGGRWGVV